MQQLVPREARALEPTALFPKGSLAREVWETGDSTSLMSILLSTYWQRLQIGGPNLVPRNVLFDPLNH